MKKRITIFTLTFMLLICMVLAGCGSDDTIAKCVIANEAYTEKATLEDASKEAKTLALGEDIYASVHFIESPKGTSYTAKWYIDEKEIGSETLSVQGDTEDILVFTLDSESAVDGKLKLEICYESTVLESYERELR